MTCYQKNKIDPSYTKPCYPNQIEITLFLNGRFLSTILKLIFWLFLCWLVVFLCISVFRPIFDWDLIEINLLISVNLCGTILDWQSMSRNLSFWTPRLNWTKWVWGDCPNVEIYLSSPEPVSIPEAGYICWRRSDQAQQICPAIGCDSKDATAGGRQEKVPCLRNGDFHSGYVPVADRLRTNVFGNLSQSQFWQGLSFTIEPWTKRALVTSRDKHEVSFWDPISE